MPRSIQGQVEQPLITKYRFWFIGGILALIIAIWLGVKALGLNTETVAPTLQNNSKTLTSQGLNIITLSTATPTLAIVSEPTIEPSSSPEPTSGMPTPSATPIVRKLDQPIGSDPKFIIHRILEGESVQQYAEMYGTTTEAIYESNYILPVPVWINWLIIIPVNTVDVGNLPAFEGYMVEKDEITLAELALKLNVDLDELARFNDLSPESVLNLGNWLLVPRERTLWPTYEP